MMKRPIFRSIIVFSIALIMLVSPQAVISADSGKTEPLQYPEEGLAGLLDYEYLSGSDEGTAEGYADLRCYAVVPAKQYSLSEYGFQLIKSFEGFYSEKYWDYTHYSIGYGSYCEPDEYPNGITEKEASDLLRKKMPSYEAHLDAFLYKYGIRVNQNQYDALVSFTYNLGGGVWKDSYSQFDLKDMLKDGVSKYSDKQIKDAFGEFCHAGGAVVKGLVTRRAKEAALFLTPVDMPIFDDVSYDSWYFEAVKYVYENGYIVGVGNNCFEPASNMTRAMIACVLQSIDGADREEYKLKWFEDVDPNSWYGSAACWMGYNGMASGIGGNLFCPNNNITREDLSVVLYRFAIYKGLSTKASYDVLYGYSDKDSISSYAVDSMCWAIDAGIISGYDNGELRPASSATRAEVAAMIRQFCLKFGL